VATAKEKAKKEKAKAAKEKGISTYKQDKYAKGRGAAANAAQAIRDRKKMLDES
jgi:hypothetical protein